MTEHEMLELILQKITGLEDKVTGLENKVTGLEDRMTGFEDRMTGFEDRMTGLENKVTGLEDGQQNILQQIDEKITASEERMMQKMDEKLTHSENLILHGQSTGASGNRCSESREKSGRVTAVLQNHKT